VDCGLAALTVVVAIVDGVMKDEGSRWFSTIQALEIKIN
jgi:hypothetical protein